MPTLDIPDTTMWYVKTGLDRALRMSKHQIERSEKEILRQREKIEKGDENQDIKDYREELMAEFRAMISYHAQWLREAREEFANLPPEIRPSLDD